MSRASSTHLVLGVLGQPVEGGHAELELARLGELAHAGAERDEVGTGHRGREVEHREREVVHTGTQVSQNILQEGGKLERRRQRP